MFVALFTKALRAFAILLARVLCVLYRCYRAVVVELSLVNGKENRSLRECRI